ncbi:MAG: helix-turn-helix domain-containing protein [Balneola sp.]
METFIPSKEELEQVVSKALEEQLSEKLPSLIRKAYQKEWLKTKDVMELTGWSKRTMQYLRDERKIPFYQEKGKILYKLEEIEEYLDSIHVEARDVEL